jgi:hypothetical protein
MVSFLFSVIIRAWMGVIRVDNANKRWNEAKREELKLTHMMQDRDSAENGKTVLRLASLRLPSPFWLFTFPWEAISKVWSNGSPLQGGLSPNHRNFN